MRFKCTSGVNEEAVIRVRQDSRKIRKGTSSLMKPRHRKGEKPGRRERLFTAFPNLSTKNRLSKTWFTLHHKRCKYISAKINAIKQKKIAKKGFNKPII